MVNTWNQELFNEFTLLRDSLKSAKKMKSYAQVVTICEKIIELDSSGRFIQIMTPIFLKEIGNAHLKQGNLESALKYLKLAKDGYITYRSSAQLNKPDDWQKDITSLEKSISKLTESD